MSKKEIYIDSVVTCACGATFETKSTKKEISAEICSECHPYYNDKHTANTRKTGRIEKFNQKYGLK